MSHQVQKPRSGREGMMRPMTPKLRPQKDTAPIARANGEEIPHADPSPVNVAAVAGTEQQRFGNQTTDPGSKPGQYAAAGRKNNKGARPLTPRFKALTFGGPQGPFGR